MLSKISALFKSNKPTPEQLYKEEHQIAFEEGKGFIIAGVVLNESLATRLEYLSNRRLKTFDDLQALYNSAMIINEKIDLEIANQRFAHHIGNTEENLLAFKETIQILNQYYRNFKRVRK